MNNDVSAFIGLALLWSVFSLINIALIFLLGRFKIVGWVAFLTIYLIWLILIAVVCFEG